MIFLWNYFCTNVILEACLLIEVEGSGLEKRLIVSCHISTL